MRYCHELYNSLMLGLHIIIALSSVLFSSYISFQPSLKGLRFSYFMVALTLGTGAYLAVSTHSRLVPVCISGLVYIAVVSIGIIVARYRLSIETRQDP
jgi:hypothetical protein